MKRLFNKRINRDKSFKEMYDIPRGFDYVYVPYQDILIESMI